jgi:hypothetical protein
MRDEEGVVVEVAVPEKLVGGNGKIGVEEEFQSGRFG